MAKTKSEEPRSGAVAGATAASTPAATAPRARLKPGATGPAVAAVQAHLGARGFASGKVDGHYGVWLERAVRGFQAFHRIPVTGEVDAETWKVIESGA